jgi:vacuolar-type H+-ATPase subunit H
MKKKSMVPEPEQEPPELLLERIIRAEMDSADSIAAARKEAERQLLEVQKAAEKSKSDAYKNGRRTRTRIIERGLEKARGMAKEKINQSEQETTRILDSGKEFVPEAIALSLDFILGKYSQERSDDK